MTSRIAEIAARLDRLNEYDREPVPPERRQPVSRFLGLFAGEHIAATEFVIGALLVLHGVGFRDLIAGLLLGNALAVLSWALVCATTATSTRLTLYWYLRRIAGPALTGVYSVVSALLSCIIAGAMVSVTATAVGLALGVPAPKLGEWPDVRWAAIAIVLGLAVTVLSVLGFERLARFAERCGPWLAVVFVSGALALLPRLGVTGLGDLRDVAESRIWTGVEAPGQLPWGFWHVVFFTWFCNMPQHLGLTDMAVLRYARHWSHGFASAAGMFIGHTLAWVSSGIMVAAVGRELNPGLMAREALGAAGALAVLLAGWTTANPTLYRAGLALQTATPGWSRARITLVAGLVVTLLACVPDFFLRLDAYIGLNGLILMPVGAIVVAEHWLFPRLGIARYQAETGRRPVHLRALVVWAVVVAAALSGSPEFVFFRALPAYLAAVALYTLVMAWPRAHPGGEEVR